MNHLDKIYSEDIKDYANAYLDYLTEVLGNIDVSEIEAFVSKILEARENGRKIFFIGNGGSAATASHFANDLAIGTNSYNKPIRAISLTDNVAIITALGNDFGYDEIFIRQLKILAEPGDLLVAISASGNSPNLVEAIDYANTHGIFTIALVAFDGGKMRKIANQSVYVKTGQKEYGPAEDAHMVLDHLVGSYLIRLIRNE